MRACWGGVPGPSNGDGRSAGGESRLSLCSRRGVLIKDTTVLNPFCKHAKSSHRVPSSSLRTLSALEKHEPLL